MLTALVALALAPASSFVHFKSPSGNINCIGAPSGPAFVECLVKSSTWPRKPPKPANCELDWVRTEIDLSHRRVGVGACRGDIGPLCVNQPGDRCTTLGYGRSVTIGPIRCDSATTGVTCRYRTAPRVGFRIAREGYVLFRS